MHKRPTPRRILWLVLIIASSSFGYFISYLMHIPTVKVNDAAKSVPAVQSKEFPAMAHQLYNVLPDMPPMVDFLMPNRDAMEEIEVPDHLKVK